MENPAQSKLSGKKILWVEDDSFLRDIIASKLAPQKCILMSASGGEQALELLKKGMPDILILDILLPGMSGFELLAKVREMPNGKDLPVIFLSNYNQQSDIAKATELGAKKFLVKATADLDEIVDQIKSTIA